MSGLRRQRQADKKAQGLLGSRGQTAVRYTEDHPGQDPGNRQLTGPGMVEEIGRVALENRLTKQNVADVYQRFDSELR